MRSLLLSSLGLGLSLSLLGCDPGAGGPQPGPGTDTASLEGRVTDESGVSGAPDDTGSALTGFAGRGTVAAAAQVQVVAVEPDGQLTVLASTQVAADGAYAVTVPTHDGVLVVQALDANANVIGRALVSRPPMDGQRRQVQPITSESSLEVQVLLQLAVNGHAPREVDLTMLRVFVDERAAIIVRSRGNLDEARVQVNALASAVWAAQTSQREAWARARVDVAARVAAQLDALAAYDAYLASRSMTELDAEADLRAQLASASLRGDVDLSVIAAAEASASATARRVMADVSLRADAALVAAWSHACAQHEAAVNAAVMVQVMTRAAVDEAQLTALRSLNASLFAQVRVANDDAALSAAFYAWRVGVRGVASTASTSMGLMSTVTQVQLSLLAQVVTQSSELGAGLNASLTAAIAASHRAEGFDFVALSRATTNIDENFRVGIDALVRTTITGLDARDGSLIVSTLVTSEGAWR